MSIERAVKLAELLIEARQQVDRHELELAAHKETVRRIEQEDLPELMQELGLETFRLKTGETIEVKLDVECSISEQRRSAAHAWLSENGFGGLIKTDVVVNFDRGEHDAAVEFAAKVGGNAVERVHPSTLKAFIKEQLEAGTAIPFETFGIRPFNRVKVSSKK